MAKWTTRDKFDDPTKSVAQSPRKVHDAIWTESVRRAIQSITNRVVCGTSGTIHGTGFNAGLGTGSTCGVRINYDLGISINGRYGTLAAQNNIYLPNGTQGSGTWVKYLVAGKFGANGTVVAGNEGASSTAALLPDCPDGYVAIGYVEYCTTSGAFGRLGGGTAGAQYILTGVAAGTCGTVTAWEHLTNMPYSES